MKPINDIITYLQENNIGTKATDLFAAYMPKEPGNIVAVFDTGGFEPSVYLPMANPTFQVYVRNSNYEDGKSKVDEIVSLLHQKANIELVSGQTYFYYIALMQEPIHIGRDENERDEFSINFRTQIRR